MENLTQENFKDKTTEGVCVVAFSATWCGPCRMLAPILEQAEAELAGKANFYKADIDQLNAITKSFGIMSVPTMIVFSGGKEVDKLVGLRTKNQIVEAVTKVL